MANPFDKTISLAILKEAEKLGIKCHRGGTIITIEGPRFSTRAESNMFRAWGADLINMSIAPEASLANEAGIAYAVIAMSTDYDCWKEDEDPVTWEEILKVFQRNADNVKQLLIDTVGTLN